MKPTSSQYAQALIELSDGSGSLGQENEITGRFVALLRRRRETKKLPAILRNLAHLAYVAAGVQRVRVTTGEVLPEASLMGLVERLQALFPKKRVIIESRVDTAALGGVALRTETELFDGTVRRRLADLQKALSE